MWLLIEKNMSKCAPIRQTPCRKDNPSLHLSRKKKNWNATPITLCQILGHDPLFEPEKSPHARH